MTKKCTSCKADIDIKVKNCPHCHADQRNWFVRHPIVISALAVIILGIIASIHIVSKNTELSNQKLSDQTQPTPTITMRHDNSGSGMDVQGDTSMQGHMQHAMQHFGL